MLSFSYKIVLLTYLSYACTCIAAENQFVTVINPGCNSTLCDGTLLVYSRLERSIDSLHVFVTVGKGLGDLAISYAQFYDPKQKAVVSWDAVFSDNATQRANALSFSNPKATLQSKFSFVLTNLIEYNDAKDSVSIPALPNNTTRKYPFSNFLWQAHGPVVVDGVVQILLSAEKTLPSDNASAPVEDSAPFNPHNGSSLQLAIQLSPTVGRAADLPQLQFTGKNTQLELLLDNLLSSWPNSRFAVESLLLDNLHKSQSINSVLNIDDEFTPGVFRMSNWLSDLSCYAQWKPVCYKADKRAIGVSTVVKNSGLASLTTNTIKSLNNGFAYVLYGGDLEKLTDARATNITFGISKDKFYAATNYTVWTFSVGIGQPPYDAVSTLVIVVILCGLGLPFLLMSAAAVYLCVRRCRQPLSEGAASAYQPINT